MQSGQDSHQGIKLFGAMITLHGRQVKVKDQKCREDQTAEKRPDNKIIPCPRCKSMETKFCYFNNYNVNQPRHFCKGCHRYWTAGGALRNVPVGAGRRKAKPPACRGGVGDGEFLAGCIYEPSEKVHQFRLDQGLVVEDWHVSMAHGDFQKLFSVKRRKIS